MGLNVYLIGFMTSGKSLLGRRLSSSLNCPLYDTDLCIEQRSSLSIPEFFDRWGEKKFREEESRLIRSLPTEGCVIVTGGGLPCHGNNMEYMGQQGLTVFVDVPESILCQRLQEEGNRKGRPLLQALAKEEIPSFVKQKLEERKQFYCQAKRRFPMEEDFDSFLQWVRKAIKPSHRGRTNININ